MKRLLFTLALASIIATTAQAAEVKNIVIVHGALADGSGSRKATEILVRRGFNVTIVQEPITSLADDVAATNRVLDLQDGPSLLVGHSYSGMVISEAGNRPDVAGLVYVAANSQNWGFIVVRTPNRKAELHSVAWDQVKITDSAITFIVVGQMADHRTLPDRLAPLVDAGIMPALMVDGWEGAAASLFDGRSWRQRDEAVRSAIFGATTLIYAAHALGLGSAPMIGFDPEAVSHHFELGEDQIPVLLLFVGRATHENWPHKPRRPLSQLLDLV